MSLWNRINSAGNPSNIWISSADRTITLSELLRGSCLEARLEELRGRSVLILTRDQLSAAISAIELDGIARQIVLWPADVPTEHLSFVMESARVDAVLSDGHWMDARAFPRLDHLRCSSTIRPAKCDRRPTHRTEWVLLTSGTTGRPKMVVHTLASLCGAIEHRRAPERPMVWSTFYDMRRYGGLQIFLRAMLTGASLVLSDARETPPEFLARAGRHGVTHISGTPSHWRRALMSGSATAMSPEYVRLSGEIADQAILDNLRACYPQARITHAFASTEAGVAFEVHDELAGFPASVIDNPPAGVAMKVADGTLRIRSRRIADRYIAAVSSIADQDGFVDTGDLVQLRDGRYYFAGRRDGTINIGGQKVHPEEVEAVINRHPRVHMSLVRSRKNPVLGALVVADVVLQNRPESADHERIELQREILQICREALPRHKVPAAIHFVPELAVAASGKIARQHA